MIPDLGAIEAHHECALCLDDFDFYLPDEAIALRPTAPRDHARLLVRGESGTLSNHHIFDLPALLRAGDVIVLNETRVLPAALKGMRPAREVGGRGDVRVLLNLHKQISDDSWRAFVRPAKRLRVGDKIIISDQLFCNVTKKHDGGDVALRFNQAISELSASIEAFGQPPLPPYIARQRAVDAQDIADYQTVFAKKKGSVAAPTAGLHFTNALLSRLKKRGLQIEKLTLHVGAGTFLPVKADKLTDHKMHSEWFLIDAPTAQRINRAKEEGRRIIAVGTTVLRALESAGASGTLFAFSGETDIFIKPGYQFQIIDGLMTNFHLPKSTLFMLTSALCGLNAMHKTYAYAIENGYRFYSYGDASLLWKAV